MVFLLGLLMDFAAPASAQAPVREPKLICRGGQIETGSHIRARMRCLSAEQWQQEDERRDRIPLSLQVTGAQGDGQPAPKRPQ